MGKVLERGRGKESRKDGNEEKNDNTRFFLTFYNVSRTSLLSLLKIKEKGVEFKMTIYIINNQSNLPQVYHKFLHFFLIR